MKSFGLWLLSVTMLGLALGCGDTTKKEPAVTPPPVADPADPADPVDGTTP